MFKKFKCLLVATALIYVNQAISDDTVYTTFTAGAVFPMSHSSVLRDSNVVLVNSTVTSGSLVQLPAVQLNNNFNTGFIASWAIGTTPYPYWRVEGELVYQYLNRNASGSFQWVERYASNGEIFVVDNHAHNIPSASFSTNMPAVMANGYFDFKNSSRLTPFIGAGIGAAWVFSSSRTHTGVIAIANANPINNIILPIQITSGSFNSAALAWQVKGGFNYAINLRLSVFLQYRLFGTTSIKENDSTITINPGLYNSASFNLSNVNLSGFLNSAAEIGLTYFIE